MTHKIEKLWREHDLPEWFLGNGESNTKLYALYGAIVEECAKIAEPWAGFWLDENSTDADRAVVAVRTEIAAKIRILAQTIGMRE